MSNEHDQVKEKLIKELANSDEKVVSNALHDLGKQGWIYDGSLRGARLQGANWGEVMLPYVDLSCADLSGACISIAFLGDANLRNAVLVKAVCVKDIETSW